VEGSLITRPRILLADDHQVVIEGLCRILEGEFEIVGVVHDGPAMVQAAGKLLPDLIVADISMPLLNGLEAMRQILNLNPKARVVFLTMHPDVPYAVEALDAGASGYVLKSAAGELLVTAIREALRGRVFVSPSITAVLVRSRSGHPPARKRKDGQPLTARQREVARLISEGRSTKEIAAVIHVSVRTVEFHKYRAIEALGLNTVAELIQFAVKHLA
jgi:DNA-binding NarL/FixJ family response regulator